MLEPQPKVMPLAGKNVKVTGTLSGDTIRVETVEVQVDRSTGDLSFQSPDPGHHFSLGQLLLKNSLLEKCSKKLCARKPYKRRSRFSWTFSIARICPNFLKIEFFNSHSPFHSSWGIRASCIKTLHRI